MENSEKQLYAYKPQFKKAVSNAQIALENGKLNSTMAWAQIGADFAWQKHLGFYTSLTLESLLLEVANKLNEQREVQDIDQKIHIPHTSTNKKHVLHVMTEAGGSGGHTRVVSAWIKNTLDTAINSVVTTAQQGHLPDDLSSSIAASGGKYQSLVAFSSNLLIRSFLLRQLSKNWADVVVLHIHPFDAIPMVAFGVAEGPPVIILDHADYTFWLGASVADVVVNLRPYGQRIAVGRRGVKTSKYLPIPLLKANPISDYEVIRRELSINKEKIVLLTVGSEYKYTPFGGYDFVNIMEKILRRNPNVILFAIGPRQKGRWAEASAMVSGRIRAMGLLDWSELERFYSCADIYIDGFPMGGLTAMLEAGAHNIPVIGLRIPEAPGFNGSDDTAIEKFDLYAPSLEAFTASLERMITQQSFRRQKTTQVKQSIERIHLPPGWNAFLDAILKLLPSEHAPALADSSNLSQDNSDIFLSGFEATVLENMDFQLYLQMLLIKHARYVSKNEWIMRILEMLLKTNHLAMPKKAIYFLKESLHTGL